MATRMREATDKRWGLWAREGPRDAVSVATELWSAAGSWEAAVRVASRTTCAGSAPRAPFLPGGRGAWWPCDAPLSCMGAAGRHALAARESLSRSVMHEDGRAALVPRRPCDGSHAYTTASYYIAPLSAARLASRAAAAAGETLTGHQRRAAAGARTSALVAELRPGWWCGWGGCCPFPSGSRRAAR